MNFSSACDAGIGESTALDRSQSQMEIHVPIAPEVATSMSIRTVAPALIACCIIALLGNAACDLIRYFKAHGNNPFIPGKELPTQHLKPPNAARFDLERRAFFAKTWLYICHATRFEKPGDYHTFELAGHPFFIVRGIDDEIRAFMNVCRHRAYTVVRKPCGTTTRYDCQENCLHM
jgi:nitrite reductase/ring-hydroxylating ferredoxin subunit